MNRWDNFSTDELQSIDDAYENADREWSWTRGECPIWHEVHQELKQRYGQHPELRPPHFE